MKHKGLLLLKNLLEDGLSMVCCLCSQLSILNYGKHILKIKIDT